jgi:single-strand DNA-binding protein
MYQTTVVVGRVGKEPESKQAGQTNVTKFSVATSEKWKDKSGTLQESTEWFNCVAFGKLGDICMNLKKGSMVLVSGKMKTRNWDKDGVKHYATDLVLDTLKFLDQKKTTAPNGKEESSDFTIDSIPF